MTKEELQRRIVEDEQMLEAILPLSDGQECLIFKAPDFSVSDEIIYIPDVWENDLNIFNSSDDDDGISYAQRVVENCYTGRDFVGVCGGDVELAKRLFHYCDWQHPSSALPELEDIEKDEITFMVKAQQAKGGATMDTEKMRRQLIDCVRDNFASYRAELLLKDRQELIDGADRITKTTEVFQYFTEHRLTEQEMGYFLKFQNPLEIAAGHWSNCTFELDALGAVIADVADKEADLTLYPLAEDAAMEKPSSPRREERTQEQTKKPSIKEQLAVKPVPGDRPTKPKEREAR